MKKILTILATLNWGTLLLTPVVSCAKKPPTWVYEADIFSLDRLDEDVILDESGQQLRDLHFNLNYVSESPTSGDATNIVVASVAVASAEEGAGDDTLRYGKFFLITEDQTRGQDLDEAPKIGYCLKFNSDLLTEFEENNADKIEQINLAVNFKGSYFQNEGFNVTLNFKFNFVNNHEIPHPPEDINELTEIVNAGSVLELDGQGNQIEDFNFFLEYQETSHNTGEPTNIVVTSATIASAEEGAGDDTIRHGEFFFVEPVLTLAHQLQYRLKFDSDRIEEFNFHEIPGFNMGVNFKGTYFDNLPFSVTKNFKFDFLSNFEKDQDFEDLIWKI